MNIDRKTRTRILTALPVAALAFSLAACSAPAERPSSEHLAEGMQQIFDDYGQGDAFTDEQLTCMADGLLASEISDQDLANLADGKDEQTSQEAYTLVQSTISEVSQDCLAG